MPVSRIPRRAALSERVLAGAVSEMDKSRGLYRAEFVPASIAVPAGVGFGVASTLNSK